MKLVVFSCSPRPEKTSNTAAIVGAFKNGFLSEVNQEVDVYFLYKRSEWDNYRKIFKENNEIIFALPLFVECVPGLLMEFLESLEPKTNNEIKTKIGFILNSGFEEACQLRTCEKYLETLPAYLNCEYSGTLIKGGMFVLALAPDNKKAKMLQPFYDMGKTYAKERLFEKSRVTKFAAPEKYSKFFCFLIILFTPINKIAWKFMARKLGATDKLDKRPYEI
jgi:multimeric flavodoxin WrbA